MEACAAAGPRWPVTAQHTHVAPGAAGNASIPGNLLRFDATVKLSSAANRTRFAQDAVKGIVTTDAANRSSYQPIAVSGIPYTARTPVRASFILTLHPSALNGMDRNHCHDTLHACQQVQARRPFQTHLRSRPCELRRQIAAPSGRALWRYAVPASANATLVLVQVCVKQNVLQEATLAVYEDGRMAWCAARAAHSAY